MYCCIVHVIYSCSNDTHSVYNIMYSVVRHVHVHPIYTYNVHVQCMFFIVDYLSNVKTSIKF